MSERQVKCMCGNPALQAAVSRAVLTHYQIKRYYALSVKLGGGGGGGAIKITPIVRALLR